MDDHKSFDPRVHICHFGFEMFDLTGLHTEIYNIFGNLYMKDMNIVFIDTETGEETENIEIKLDNNKMRALLPMIRWEDFETMRASKEEWFDGSENGCAGYRDGWGYIFRCMSEIGKPPIEIHMGMLYDMNKLPPHEKLLRWALNIFRHKLRHRRDLLRY